MTNRPSISAGGIAEDARREGEVGRPVPPTRSARETAEYLRAMLQELTTIARAEKFDMLAYLIGMAHSEAADVVARNAARARTARDG